METSTSWQYPFDFSAAYTIEAAPGLSGFLGAPERSFVAATPAWGLSQDDLAAVRTLVAQRAGQPRAGDGGDLRVAERPGDAWGALPDGFADGTEGVAEAFVDVLRHEVVPPVPGFRVVRLGPPPEASGERPIGDNPAGRSVVVGERVVVTWARHIEDADHAGPAVHAHLDAVDFFGVPQTYGILMWTAPSGREVPVAWATKYLPRARDGWDWCVELAQRALGLHGGGPTDPWQDDFPGRLGRTAAKLHVALATSSKVIPQPTQAAPADLVRAWHSAASAVLDRAIDVAERDALEGAREVLLPRVPALRAAVDSLLEVAGSVDGGGLVMVQRVHGDLHVGQLLRWPGGIAVIDFHPQPAIGFAGLSVGQLLQPAARDLARLLRSVDHAGRVADKSSGFTSTVEVDRWSEQARATLLREYRAELTAAGRPELLDERLMAAFEAEQLCREIVYASEHLPSWAYAPLGGLWQHYPVLARPEPGRRGRHADAGLQLPVPR